MTVEELIRASLRKITAYASGESPTANELSDGLSALQSMLRRWASKKILVFASTKESFTLTAGTYLYTFGVGGTFNSARPYEVVGAYVLDGTGVTHGVDIISEGKYRSISVKGTASRPYALFFHPTYPLAEVYLYPVPDSGESLYIDSFKPFTETSSIDATTSTLAFPPNYEEALIYNLAVRLSSEFGKAVTIEVAALAESSYSDILHLNAANQMETVQIILPVSSPYGARYSINSDSYH
jgi:hypothetical protein